MGYGLTEFAEVRKVVARENNEVDRKHVMPGGSVCKISRMRLGIMSCFLAAFAAKSISQKVLQFQSLGTLAAILPTRPSLSLPRP